MSSRKAKALEFVDAETNIQITGRHIEVTEAMKNYAMEKLSKIERLTQRLVSANVILDIQKIVHHAEIILKTDNIKITGSAISNDMYISIDKAMEKIEAQLLRYKSRIQDHHARAITEIPMNVEVLRIPRDEESYEVSENEFDRFRPHEIVKQETKPLKTLTYDEAIMKMELSNDPFLLFKNEEDLRLKLIYRRKDGHYGIIEPSC